MSAALPVLQLGEHAQWIEIAFIVVFLVMSLCIHEVAHAWVADLCGDSTAKDLGRITLNPLPHIDPMMTVILPVAMLLASNGQMAFGGAKPVPVNYGRLRHPLRDMSFVALAGPASNFLLAIVFLLGWKASVLLGGYPEDSLLPRVLLGSMATNLLLAAFNMVPIPPLDGSRVMTWLLPAPLRDSYLGLERIGILLVILVWYFVPPVKHAVYASVNWMYDFIYMITGGTW